MKQRKTKDEKAIPLPEKICFYCKDCEKIVKVKKVSTRKYIFKCTECQKNNVSFGTEKSIKNHYRIKDNSDLLDIDKEDKREEKEKKKDEEGKKEDKETKKEDAKDEKKNKDREGKEAKKSETKES